MTPKALRLAGCVLSAALLSGCGASKPAAPAASPSLPPGTPANAAIPRAGAEGKIPLDAAERAELDRIVAGVASAQRKHLRYALALGDDGRRHLVVYDGEGLPPDGREPGRHKEYLVFAVLDGNGAHYDPQQNALIAPIAPPPERGGAIGAR